MAFKLSQRSLGRLDGEKTKCTQLLLNAITVSNVDFGVICGLRTKKEQEDLVARGASQTMKSKHLTGDAVDLMAYVSGRASWEVEPVR